MNKINALSGAFEYIPEPVNFIDIPEEAAEMAAEILTAPHTGNEREPRVPEAVRDVPAIRNQNPLAGLMGLFSPSQGGKRGGGSEGILGGLLGNIGGGLGGVLERLSPDKLEMEDLMLMLILYFLYRESGDTELLIIMAAMFLLD